MDPTSIPARSLAGRLLRRPLRLIPPGASLPVLNGPLRGLRWIAGAGNHSCWLGWYEPSKQRQFHELIRPGDVVYDLGANSGYFSLLASTLTGPGGRVISFEPLPDNLVFLRRHLAINEIQNCTVVDAAVGSSEGLERFARANGRSEGHLVTSDEPEADSIQVRVVTLDGLVERGEIPPPALLKCDIEGGELEALRGAEGMLRRWHPTLLVDLHTDEGQSACRHLLSGLGYRLTALDGLPLSSTGELLAAWSGKE